MRAASGPPGAAGRARLRSVSSTRPGGAGAARRQKYPPPSGGVMRGGRGNGSVYSNAWLLPM